MFLEHYIHLSHCQLWSSQKSSKAIRLSIELIKAHSLGLAHNSSPCLRAYVEGFSPSCIALKSTLTKGEHTSSMVAITLWASVSPFCF